MTPVAVCGAAGRMGQLLVSGIAASEDLSLAAAFEGPDHPALGQDCGGVALQALDPRAVAQARVVIDFSLPAGTRALLHMVSDQALVIGVTGLGALTRQALETHAGTAPVVVASNFSTGVNVLLGLVRQAAGTLADYDLEIVEMHHGRKRDAPSGTARSLAEAAADARGVDLDARAVHGRQGEVGARPPGEIGLHALRGGDVAGEHTVYLAGPGERLALNHLATSRQAFADGALRAARWAASARPGLYDMQDVLGFHSGVRP